MKQNTTTERRKKRRGQVTPIPPHSPLGSKKSFSYEFWVDENKVPLSQRPIVLNHPKFKRDLRREDSEELLRDSELNAYVFRPSSAGEDYLVLTIVIDPDQWNLGTDFTVNKKGYAISHFLFDPSNIRDQPYTDSEDPIGEIIKGIQERGCQSLITKLNELSISNQ